MKKEEKTIREWLNELPEPYRTEALANESSEWWDDFHKKLEKGEIQLEKEGELLSKNETPPISFKQITDNLADLLEYKNSKYGDAVLNPLSIFSGKCKAGYRMDDKLSRILNSDELKLNDLLDLIGYGILTLKEKGWVDYSQFKD